MFPLQWEGGKNLKQRLISLFLALSMLCSLCTTAFALEAPATPTGGVSIFVDDVRVEAKDTDNPVDFKIVLSYDPTAWDMGRTAKFQLSVPAATTGISETSKAQLKNFTGVGRAYFVQTAQNFENSGTGDMSMMQGSAKTFNLIVTVPNVTATSKISLTPVSGEFYARKGTTPNQQIPDNKVTAKTGSIILQYPVTVAVEGAVPTGASATVKTTEYDTGKATYNASGKTTTPLTNGSTLWVDSGNGQQNTPALDLTAPAGYKAEVKVGSGDWQLAGKNFSIGEVKAATTVSIRYTQTTADTVTVTVTDKYGKYDLGTWQQTGEQHATNKATVSAKPYTGYTAYAYSLNGGNQIDGTSVEVLLTGDQAVTFFYKRSDNSAVVPGKDNNFGTDDDVVIKPTDPDKTPTVDDTTGTVTVPNDTTGTVTRPKDPTNPGNGKEDIVVPGGTTVDKDGTIHLPQKPGGTEGGTINPGDKLPENAPAGTVIVTYKANGGTGDDVLQIGDTSVKALDQQHTAPANKGFESWNTQESGKGDKYEVGAEITATTTLFAQWSSSPYNEKVEITFNSNLNGVNAEKQTIGYYNGTSSTENLRKNSFAYTGWTFGGWSNAQIGEVKYADGASFTFNKGDADTLALYAQWYKQDGSSITVPGKDGDPSNEMSNVTGSGDGISRDTITGIVTIPNGGTITINVLGNMTETITLPNGGTLNPDGSYTINLPNGGKIDVDTDGNEKPKDENGDPKPNAEVVSLIYHINNDVDTDDVIVRAIKNEKTTAIANPFTYDGHVFLNWMANLDGTVTEIAAGTGKFTPTTDSVELYAQWAKKNTADGSIELPGKDGVLEAPQDKDNVTVTPDKPNGTLDSPKDDGSVEVKGDEATVTRPDPTAPDYPNGDNKEEIRVPEGTVISPDGTITLPQPDGTVIPPDKPFPGDDVTPTQYIVVTYEPNGGTGDVVKQIIAKDAQNTKTLAADTFTAPAGDVEQVFDKWVNAADENDTYAAEVSFTPTENITLKALWKRKGITYKVDINLVSGTDVRVQRAEGNDKQFDATLRANPFTAPVEGWIFMGWSTDANGCKDGTFYKDQDRIQLDVTKNAPTLCAIWYKADAASGTITLPGKDNDPTTADNNVTVNPGNGTAPTVKNDSNEGYIEANGGNTVHQPAGPITVIDGPVRVYPDGTVYVPAGSKVTDKDGKEVTGPATIDPDGKTDPGEKDDPKKDTDNSIIIPGKDGFIDPPNDVDNLIVKPDGNGHQTGSIDKGTGNTTITAPDGADVSIPGTNPPDTRADIKLPEGTVIKPDGTIILPDGKDGKDDTGGTIPGGSEIDKDGVVTYKYTVVYLDENDRALERPTYVNIKTDGTKTVRALTIPGYTVVGDASKEVTARPKDPSNYTITFKYEKVVDTLTITPANEEAKPGDRLTFTAQLNGADTPDVTWSITGATSANTTIDENTGILTIGADEAENTVLTVTAASTTDSNLTASTTVTVKADPILPTLTLRIDPTDVIVYAGDTVRFTAYVNDVESDLVTWAVSGTKSTINANGVLSVSDDETNGTVLIVTVTSTEEMTVAATATVNVRVKSTPITPSRPSKPSQRPEVPTKNPATGVTLPEYTGVAKWLETENHIAYMSGIGAGRFDPNANMTRAQVAQMFYNLLLDKRITVTASFSDVPSGKWYTEAVNALASLGIIQGSNGKFRPNDPITRAEFVAIAMRFADTVRGASANFTDVSTSAWYYDSIASAVSYGWIGGYSDGSFRPTKPITRAEVVTIVNRMLDRSFDSSVSIGFVTNFSDVPVTHWAFGAISEATTSHDHTSNNGVESWR